MTTDRCDRTWQVEALEDGRLEVKDRASFARHSETCGACSAELRRLRELERLMTCAPAAERTELERRRLRNALLGAANQRVVERQGPSRKTLQLALACGLPLLLLCAVVFARISTSRSHPGFEVVDVARAEWTAEKVGTTSRVTLRCGVAAFHVEHVSNGARFLVKLPDGEIEVRGTRFVVDVALGHTHSVLVTEGVVALRIDGAEHVLHPGERWQSAGKTAAAFMREDPLASSASRVAAAPFDGSAPARRVATAEPSMSHAISSQGVSSPPRPLTSARVPAVLPKDGGHDAAANVAPSLGTSAPAGPRFAAAMAAFGAGDFGRADTLFEAFVHDFPSDSRAEDAAFLRADARARRGDKAGAAAAARAYLRAYPNGLRRPAAERLTEIENSRQFGRE